MKKITIVLIVFLSFFSLVLASPFLNVTDTEANPIGTTLSIKIHQIQEIDELEGGLFQGEEDWYYKIYIYDGNMSETPNIYAPSDTDNPILNNIHPFTVHEPEVIICIKLMENDVIWDDLADISGYMGGGTDGQTDWQRGTGYVGHYSLLNNSLWGDKTFIVNSYGESYFYTSGEMAPDSSVYTDENDAAILFQIWDDYEEQQEDDDMLIITNQNNLFTNYGSQAQNLLNKIVEIADSQNGTILFTDGCKNEMEIKELIRTQASNMSNLKYLMIVGGEEIIPFWKPTDPTPSHEEGYDKYVLSDYYYGDLNDDEYIDLSIGRIIGDEIEDMISLLDASSQNYQGNNVTVAGDDFMIEDTETISHILSSNGFLVDDLYGYFDLIWLLFHIQNKMLIFHEGHADWWIWCHKLMTFPPYLAAWKVQLAGLGGAHPIVHSIGCHAGKVRSWMGDWSSIPLAFIDEGAVAYIGGTGTQYGNSAGEGLSETIARYFIEKMLEGKTVGESLKEAKLEYINNIGHYFTGFHKKIILQHTLYGNPKFKPSLASQLVTQSVNVTYVSSGISFLCKSAGSYIHSLYANVSISTYNITHLENGYDLISIPGEGFTMEEGEFALPSVTTEILLPKGSELCSINLTSCNKKKLPGTYNIPISHIEIIGFGNQNNSSPQSNISLNHPLYSSIGIENPNGTKTIVIQISPIEYNPDTNEVSLYNYFNFSIEYLLSNIQMSDLVFNKLQFEPGENISISTNIVNTWSNLTNLSLYASVEGIGITTNVTNNVQLSTFSFGADTIGIWNGTFNESGYYFIKAVLKDSLNNTLDTKYGMTRVAEKPTITVSTVFLEQDYNITPKVIPHSPFNLTIAVDNMGDYNATGVTATLILPPEIYTMETLTKNVNNGIIPGFGSEIVQWTLITHEPGNHTVEINVSSVNGGTCLETYNVSATPGPQFSGINVSSTVIPEDTDGNPLLCPSNPSCSEVANISVNVSSENTILGVTINLMSLGWSPVTPMTHSMGTDAWYVLVNATPGTALHDETGYVPHGLVITATDAYGNQNTTTVNITVWKNGDANEDGMITLYDATYIAKWYFNQPGFDYLPENVADVSGDCQITLYDATYLAKWNFNQPGFEVLK